MIQWVWQAAIQSPALDQLIIATDSDEIFKVAQSFGAEVRMTSPNCQTGTDRVAEVSRGFPHPIVVNLQGDETLIRPQFVNCLVEEVQEWKQAKMATLAVAISQSMDCTDTSVVKVTTDAQGFASDFFRSAPKPTQSALKHLGLYAFRKDFLQQFCRWPQSPREKSERLEQLRALDRGCKIRVSVVESDTISVDNPEDIFKVERQIHDRVHNNLSPSPSHGGS